MHAVDRGLHALMARGFRFQHLTDEDGYVAVVIGSYGWPECYDRIHIHGEHEAAAARALLASRPGVDEVVWTYQGDAVSTMQALLEIPEPHEPGAPRLARRAPLGLWLPDTGHARSRPHIPIHE